MTERLISINGELLPESAARVSLYDSAMMYGDHVFTMLRTFNGTHVWRAEKHADRLAHAMQVLHYDPPGAESPTRNVFLNWSSRLFEANTEHFAGRERRLTWTVGRGALPIYESADIDSPRDQWVMMTEYPLEWVCRNREQVYSGVTAAISERTNIPDTTIPSFIKHHNRLNARLAEVEVQRLWGPDVWIIVQTPTGHIAEFTGANLFAVMGRALWTPPANYCYPGVTRGYILELARLLGIRVEVAPFTPRILQEQASEIFATCTPWCIVPVTRLNERELAVGPVTERLMQAWIDEVQCDWRKDTYG